VKLLTHHDTLTSLGLEHISLDADESSDAFQFLDMLAQNQNRPFIPTSAFCHLVEEGDGELMPMHEAQMSTHVQFQIDGGMKWIGISTFKDGSRLISLDTQGLSQNYYDFVPWGFSFAFSSPEQEDLVLQEALIIIDAMRSAPPLVVKFDQVPDSLDGNRAYPWFSTSLEGEAISLKHHNLGLKIALWAKTHRGLDDIPNVWITGRSVSPAGGASQMRFEIRSLPEHDWTPYTDRLSNIMDGDNPWLLPHEQIAHSGPTPGTYGVALDHTPEMPTGHEIIESTRELRDLLEETSSDHSNHNRGV
jgi:hypothetical protein